jgi:hypothetical protein
MTFVQIESMVKQDHAHLPLSWCLFLIRNVGELSLALVLADGIGSAKIFEVNMTHTTRHPSKKPLLFPVPQDDVEERILAWIHGIVQSNYQLVGALERLRHSYKALLAGKPVTDAEKSLWQVEVAVKGAERSKGALDSERGPDRA